MLRRERGDVRERYPAVGGVARTAIRKRPPRVEGPWGGPGPGHQFLKVMDGFACWIAFRPTSVTLVLKSSSSFNVLILAISLAVASVIWNMPMLSFRRAGNRPMANDPFSVIWVPIMASSSNFGSVASAAK